jgi:hypothetical protein
MPLYSWIKVVGAVLQVPKNLTTSYTTSCMHAWFKASIHARGVLALVLAIILFACLNVHVHATPENKNESATS